MPFVAQRSTLADAAADIDRRIRNLETAPRFGLASIGFASQDRSMVVQTWATWVDDGVPIPSDPDPTAVNLPTLTTRTGTQVIVTTGVTVDRFGTGPTALLSAGGRFGIGIDGGHPDDVGTFAYRLFRNVGNASRWNQQFSFQVTGLTRGEHSFAMWVMVDLDDATFGAEHPVVADSWLMVMPIDVV